MAKKSSISMEIGNDGVALITMINPPVNALTLSGSFLFYSQQKFQHLVIFIFLFFLKISLY